jgi:hypothetical protein
MNDLAIHAFLIHFSTSLWIPYLISCLLDVMVVSLSVGYWGLSFDNCIYCCMKVRLQWRYSRLCVTCPPLPSQRIVRDWAEFMCEVKFILIWFWCTWNVIFWQAADYYVRSWRTKSPIPNACRCTAICEQWMFIIMGALKLWLHFVWNESFVSGNMMHDIHKSTF